ncbi:ABC transporter ATP-binding protein [Micromonospora sp. NPDC000089]|uniref:ABC transporter ATP-binding protein n=1 Tax=unclassified Micromonospora TaxID=2617518 RepID=UPI00369070F3
MLIPHLRKHRAELITLGTWSAVEAAPTFTSGVLIACALDDGFLAGRPGYGVALLTLQLVVIAAAAVAVKVSARPMAGVVEPLRDDLVTRLITALLGRAERGDTVPPGDVVARLTTQAESVRMLCNALLRGLRPLLFRVVAALMGLATLDPTVAAVVLVPLSLALLFFWRVVRSVAAAQQDVLRTGENLAGVVEQAIDGLRDIQACRAQRKARSAVGDAVDASVRAALVHARLTASRVCVPTFGIDMPTVGVLLAAPWLMSHGQLTVGELAGAVTFLVTGLAPATRSVVGTVGTWGVELSVVLRRLGATTSPHELPRTATDVSGPITHDLTLSDVGFSYDRQPGHILSGLNLTLPEGSHLAIVGESGTGKSTLAAIIAGLVAPTTGSVAVGNVPVRGLTPAERARHIMLLPQTPYVFGGTLRANLTYLAPASSDDEIRQAIDILGGGDLCARLGGLGAILAAQNGHLTQGEKQLLCLIRAYLCRAPVVILDEATAHLDSTTEARVEQAFRRRVGSLVVVTHRLSSAARADRVLLLENGAATVGSMAELTVGSSRFTRVVSQWTTAAQDTAAVGSGKLRPQCAPPSG